MPHFPTETTQHIFYPVGPDPRGVTLTAGLANVKGAYVTVAASTAFAANSIEIWLGATTTTACSILMDLAVGPAAGEVVLIPDILAESAATGALRTGGNYPYLLAIASGARIAMRCQASVGAITVSDVAVRLNRAGDTPGVSSYTAYGVSTASSLGTSVDPGGTINVKGAYSEITAATSALIQALSFVVTRGVNQGAIPDGMRWAFDIATGPAASETILIPDIRRSIGFGLLHLYPRGDHFLTYIPAGTRIAVRSSVSLNDATDRVLTVGLAGATGVGAAHYPQSASGLEYVTYPVGPVAAGTVVSGSGTANTKGSYVEFVAALDFDANVVQLNAVTTYPASRQILLDLATGPAGAETVRVANILADGADTTSRHTGGQWVLPIFIAAGSRIAIRAQLNNTVGEVELALTLGAAGDTVDDVPRNATTYGADLSDSGGTVIDPGAVLNTKGSYTEITASTTNVHNALMLSVSYRGNTAGATEYWAVDIATGPAGSETALIPDLRFALATVDQYLTPKSYTSLVYLPIGTRLAVRASCTANNATDRLIDVALIAFDADVPAVITLAAVAVRSTAARIRGRIDPNGHAMTGWFEWGTSPASLLNSTVPVDIGSGDTFVAYDEALTGLEPDTTYYFRAVGDDGTDTIFGEILSFSTRGEQQFIDGQVSFPLTWLTITTRDGVRRPYAEVDLNDAPDYYDGYKKPLVERFLTISRGLSDRDGQIEHLNFGMVASDIGYDFREMLDDAVNKYLTNRPAEEWFIDDEERRVEGLARLAAVGFVNNYAPRPNLQFEVNCADWLKKKFSRKRKAQQSWQPLITIEDFPNCPEEHLNTPAPLVYGSLGLTGADPVEDVTITVNAQPTAAPGSFALSLQPGGRHSGVRRYYKVAQIVGGLESVQSAILSATTTDANRTIRSSWTPSGSATAIYLYSSDKVDFSQFALTILPGSATQYDDDTTPPNQDARHLDGTDWVLGLRLNLKYYVYAKLADGLYSRPGIASTFLAPVPVRAKVPGDRTGPLRQRDIDVAWTAHPDEDDGYRIIRWRSYYSDWSPLFDRQIDVGTGVLTTTDDIVTTSSVDIPTGELTALSASGQVEAIPVGELDGGSPDDTLNGLLVCRCASSRVGNIYIPVTTKNVEGEDETTYEPIPESAFGVTWFAPDHAGWLFGDKFVDINGRRYTLIFTTVSPLPEQVFVDVDGIEEDGDGEGTLITSIVDQRLHFMNNFIAPDTPYQSGSYLTAADTVFPHIAGLTLVDEASHALVKAQLAERLGTGDYEGATIIGAGGEFVTATDALARFQVSGDFDQWFNRKGQDSITCEPITASENPPAVTDIISIRDGSFAIQDLVQTAFFNILPYVHTRDYTGRHRTGWYGSDEERSQTSIDNYDQERESPRFELHCLRSNTAQGLATIQDVMARKLARFQDPFRVGTMMLPFSALDYEPGSSVAVTHIEGIGASGWTGKEVRITRHEVEPTEGIVRLDFYDLTKVFENQGSP